MNLKRELDANQKATTLSANPHIGFNTAASKQTRQLDILRPALVQVKLVEKQTSKGEFIRPGKRARETLLRPDRFNEEPDSIVWNIMELSCHHQTTVSVGMLCNHETTSV